MKPLWRAGVGLWCMVILLIPSLIRAQESETRRRFVYWDLGLQISVPDSWDKPVFSAGQVVIAPAGIVGESTVKGALVAIGIVDPLRDLGLSREATLEDIAAKVSIVPDSGAIITNNGTTTIAGLAARYISLHDPTNKVRGLSIAFMMPDGRIGTLIGLAPEDQWGEESPLFEEIRASAVLIKPSAFIVPSLRSRTVAFTAGKITFALPEGWGDYALAPNASIYHDLAFVTYQDDSGFNNGAQLVLIAETLDKTLTLRDAVAKVIGADTEAKEEDILIGGRAGVRFTETHRATGQIIMFIGVPNGEVLNIFRWTTPGILVEATRPILDSILTSVRFVN